MLRKFILSASFLLLATIASIAQNADSLFTSLVDGRNVLAVRFTSEMPLAKVSNDYNVSEELLRLFNDKLPAKVQAGDQIIVPLVESNYYKNTSLQLKNGMYLPLYHMVNEGETLMGIARSYLLPETSIMRWNDLTSTAIETNTVLLIGWLRFGNQQTAFNKAEDSRLMQIKGDVSRTMNNAKEKIGTTANNVGDRIKETAKPVEVERPKIIDSTKSAFKEIRQDVNTGLNTVNEKFKKLQDDITAASNKLSKNLSTSYSREKEKLEQDRADRIKKREAEKQTKINASPVVKEWVNTNTNSSQKTNAEVGKIETPNVELSEPKISENAITIEDADTEKNATSLYDLAGNNQGNQEHTSYIAQEQKDTELLDELEKAATQRQKEVVASKPAIANPKTKVAKKVTAAWFYTGELGSELFAITNVVAEGKQIVITNPANGKQVQATVMGKLSDEELASGLTLLLSSSAQPLLKTTETKLILQAAEIIQ
jgi:LysM repeat protein